MEGKDCSSCKYARVPPVGEPCNDCRFGEHWEPKFIPAEEPMFYIDPGAPEGDKTNVRIDWGETGREIIISLEERKKLLDYAIFGAREKIKDIGLELTRPEFGVKDYARIIDVLTTLNWDLGELEDKRAMLERSTNHVNGCDA